ncbi:PQQ-dependent dehydrogenase, methanol/ethanol family [Stutzerimonas balearica]|uniref:PQQ-dependent dehydrogenase, methanol/ethanol family n=1 Tax=Stutzerimonas balearica TaxID=74829 RepID=UPI0022AEC1A4|nr:PQQ-dependent dehydrogenase, methanol/ethanol family [Stutzerimonas balearica]MCZ4129770.1 PQQ-dependent dehydrogenase, methanol/ethanol family [Stutzerimonas balearica]
MSPRSLSRLLPLALAVHASCVLAAPLPDQGWPQHGLDAAETRFSPLAQIDRSNVGRLGMAWQFRFDRPRGVQATPLMVGETLYVSGPWGVVYALDARNGELRWQHDPLVPAHKAAVACCDVVNRGVAVAHDRVFVGTLDGRLQALDAGSGELLWSTQTTPPERPYTITGAPRVVGDLVMIGNGGAEYGVRGYLSAYDAASGELRWRFYTVPGDPAEGADGAVSDEPLKNIALPTWTGQWWLLGGGGTVWDSMAYDPELDLLYFGVGNGSPHDRDLRSPEGGDNLFLSSIVAVHAKTGEYAWHYQTTPGDSWDYTATQHMILAELRLDGRQRKVLMQAPKNGFFYVLDRETGELLSAANYVPTSWASHVDLASGRPVEVPGARYPAGQPAAVTPSQIGGHNWQPMAWNPLTGLVYIPAQESQAYMVKAQPFRIEPGRWNTGVQDHPLPTDAASLAQARQGMRGHLLAWDPVRQREAWRSQQPGMWNGGVLTTAGRLVFQGQGGGGLHAYDAETGERLWQSDTWLDILGGPISYRLDGKQYIAAAAGFGSSMHLSASALLPRQGLAANGGVFVWTLDGKARLPEPQARPPMPPLPDVTADPATLQQGAQLYTRYCMVCHGAAAVAGAGIPDLRYSAYLQSAEAFRRPPLEGLLQARGMPSFAGSLDQDAVESIRAYVIQSARDTAR